MPSLLNMPDVVMSLILEKSDFRAIQNLRKSCRDLRNFIDDVKPESKLTTVEVSRKSDEFPEIALELFLDGQYAELVYQKIDDGCLVTFNDKEKLLENSDFWEVACRDIQSLLDSRNSLNHLDINASSLLEPLRNILQSRRQKIKVESFSMYFQLLNQVIEFLPLLDSVEQLKLGAPIPMHSTILDVSELLKTEHWKHLKQFHTNYFHVDIPIDDLIHLEQVYLSVKEITLNMVLRLKEEFLRSPHMSHFVFYYEQFDSNHHQLIEIFGPIYERRDEEDSYWQFRIPSDPGNVLQIVNRVSQNVLNHFSFARLDS